MLTDHAVGGPLTYSTLSSHWDKVRKYYAGQTGDPKWADWDLYELRHFGAHYLWQVLGPKHGIDADMVAFQLGHSDDRLVKRLYGHPDHDRWRETMLEAFKAEAATRRV